MASTNSNEERNTGEESQSVESLLRHADGSVNPSEPDATASPSVRSCSLPSVVRRLGRRTRQSRARTRRSLIGMTEAPQHGRASLVDIGNPSIAVPSQSDSARSRCASDSSSTAAARACSAATRGASTSSPRPPPCQLDTNGASVDAAFSVTRHMRPRAPLRHVRALAAAGAATPVFYTRLPNQLVRESVRGSRGDGPGTTRCALGLLDCVERDVGSSRSPSPRAAGD